MSRIFVALGRFFFEHPYIFTLILAILTWLGLIAGYE